VIGATPKVGGKAYLIEIVDIDLACFSASLSAAKHVIKSANILNLSPLLTLIYL
jgi:hypothetical protein